MYLEISLSNLDSPYDNSKHIADAYNEFASKLIIYDSFSLLKSGLTYLLFAFCLIIYRLTSTPSYSFFNH